ncbi:MAG: response regulator transcription factor [Kiritimatiellae bacterium]|nr:response regulator transcription factor [Kiritimatiellia bacterium]
MHDTPNDRRDAAPPPEPWILLGVPDPPWRAAVRAAASGLAWRDAPDAAAARSALRGAGEPPALAAFDRDALGAAALALCRDVRASAPAARIAVLSADLAPEGVRAALEAGADFSMPRPPPESFALLAASWLRKPVPPRVLESGPLAIRPESGEVEVDGAPVALTPTEVRVLAVLASKPGRVVARGALLRELHGESGGNTTPRAVDAMVKALRRKLGRAAAGIETVRGYGYRWNPECSSTWRRAALRFAPLFFAAFFGALGGAIFSPLGGARPAAGGAREDAAPCVARRPGAAPGAFPAAVASTNAPAARPSLPADRPADPATNAAPAAFFDEPPFFAAPDRLLARLGAAPLRKNLA